MYTFSHRKVLNYDNQRVGRKLFGGHTYVKEQNGYVRSIDVAHHLNFTKPSVSVAMKSFREEGYVTVDTDGNINLPTKVWRLSKIYERHQVIAKALIALGVDEETAYDDSCKRQHDLSDITFQKIKEYFLSHTNENI